LNVESPSSDSATAVSVDARLAKNATWLLVAQVATLASGLAILVAIGRLLTPEDLGRWRFAQAVLAYVLVLADAGFTAFAIREIARRHSEAVADFGLTMVLLRLSVSGFALAAILVAFAVAGLSSDTILVTGTMGATALATALGANYLLQAREDFGAISAIRITAQIVGALGVVAAIIATRSIHLAAFAVLLSGLLATVLTDRLAARFGAFGGHLSVSDARRFLQGAAPFIGAGLAVLVIFNADAFLIQLLRGERELGLYAAPYAIAGYSLVIGGALVAAAYPRMARASGHSASYGHVRELSAVMGAISLPIAIGGMVTAEPLLATLFGQVYADNWALLVVLMFVPLLGFLNMTLGQSMAAAGEQRAVFLTAVMAAGANVSLNLLGIPILGIMGAAIVASVTEVITLGLYSRVAARLRLSVPLGDYLGSLPAAAFMGIGVILLRSLGVTSILVLLPVGVAIYAGFQMLRPSRGALSLRNVFAPGPKDGADPA
jgi:O-antigen/teichoic acid export membrane protein